MKILLTVPLREALSAYPQFQLQEFSKSQIETFCRYYELVLKWNPLLHLTTLSSPVDFAERHILESAFAVPHLIPPIRQVMDIGSGCGTPGVPIAILRPDLTINLVETSKKKAIFLKEVAGTLGIKNLNVLNQRFEEIRNLSRDFCLTSRALDEMNRLLPKLIKLGLSGSQILFWGNRELLEIVPMYLPPEWNCLSSVIPQSKNRLLISLLRST